MYPSPGFLRSYESLGLKTLFTPTTILRSPLTIPRTPLKARSIPNLRLTPDNKPIKSPLEDPEFPPYILNVMWKQGLGISDCFDVIGSSPRYREKDQGMVIALDNTQNKVRKEGSSSSGQPVGLGVGLPPLAKPSSLDLVSSFIPLFLLSYAYFSSYSVSDLLSILENMGMNSIWLKEMLGMSVGNPSDITTFVDASQLSSNEVVSEVQKVISNYQFLKLLSLVAGSVGVGAILLFLASNGAR